MKNKILLLFTFVFFISLAQAIPDDGGTVLDFEYETPINYSAIPTVNNSDCWDGNCDENSKLDTDGSNANLAKFMLHSGRIEFGEESGVLILENDSGDWTLVGGADITTTGTISSDKTKIGQDGGEDAVQVFPTINNNDEEMHFGVTDYGHSLWYVGTGAGDANYLELRSDNSGGSEITHMRVHQASQVVDFLSNITAPNMCYSDGTNCTSPAPQNPFDQSLNTTDNVEFNQVNTSKYVSEGNMEFDAFEGSAQFFKNERKSDTDNGNSLYLYRNAAEGTTYFRGYVDEYKNPRWATNAQYFYINGQTAVNIPSGGLYVGAFNHNQNPLFRVYGEIDSADSRAKYAQLQVDDTDDKVRLSREDFNITAFAIDMPLEVDNDTLIGGDLNVTGDADVGGDLNISGNLTINDKQGLTANYSVGNCWMAYSGGIMYETNCSSS